MASTSLHLLLAVSLLGNAFSVPTNMLRIKRGFGDNELDSKENDSERASSGNRVIRQSDSTELPPPPPSVIKDIFGTPASTDETPQTTDSTSTSTSGLASPQPLDDDDDDDDFNEPIQTSSTNGGGSNIFSLLRLATALFPGSSGANIMLRNFVQDFLIRNQGYGFNQAYGYNQPSYNFIRRQDGADNEIEIDYVSDLKPPPLKRQESDEDVSEISDESESSDRSESESLDSDDNDADNAAEESIETNKDNGSESKSKQESAASDSSDYDSDEPPGGGDGQGGGILGLIAGLSGGEDGQSDLGSLLATVSGIIANLSGDGIDLNALIASGIGLFVGLLSEGEENPGSVLASYLLTSLDTITGGGSKNNGAFFGTFLSKLIKGTSASQGNSQEQSNPFSTLKLDILRALLQFGTSLLGLASTSSSSGSSSGSSL